MSTIHQCGSNLKGKKRKQHCKPLRSFFNSPQKKGVATKFRLMSPKKPNSAKRRIVRLRLSNSYMVTAKIKGQGHSLQVYAEVLVCGGRANDLPGVRYNMVRGKFGFSWKERIFRIKARSKYGIGADDHIFLGRDYYEEVSKKSEEQSAIIQEKLWKKSLKWKQELRRNLFMVYGDNLHGFEFLELHDSDEEADYLYNNNKNDGDFFDINHPESDMIYDDNFQSQDMDTGFGGDNNVLSATNIKNLKNNSVDILNAGDNNNDDNKNV